MAKRTHNQNSHTHGQWNVICDVCGFKFKSSDINERWDGLMVCADDYEKRHPADFFKVDPEDTSVPFVRHDTDDGTAPQEPTRIDTTEDVPTGTFDGSL